MQVRLGDIQRLARVKPRPVDYSAVTRKRRAAPVRRRAWRNPLHLRRLLVPYLGALHGDQLRAVVPLAAYLALFQIIVLQTPVAGSRGILLGLAAVVVGLVLFMEGLRVGLMPFGEAIGHALPQRLPLRIVLAVAFTLGIGVTLAEPAIGALQMVGQTVDPQRAPILYALLNGWSFALIAAVGLGVGSAATLGLLRCLYGWSLKPFIFGALVGALGLSLLCSRLPHLGDVLSLAWDCGAVTTGPVTVPLVLALGMGVARASGERQDGLAGFGIVTLASLMPVIAVLLLALLVAAVTGGQPPVVSEVTESGWFAQSPWREILGGLRAIVPLVIFLVVVAKSLARATLEDRELTVVGIGLTLIGMITFSLGLSYGLSALGEQAGRFVPAAFAPLPSLPGSPLYSPSFGLVLALVFAWILGFGATVAEPALNAMGAAVETLTSGAMTKRALISAVSLGVGSGIALGLAKMVFGFPIFWLLLAGYGLAALLTLISSETFVNVAWDSAGVTTGPVTVPLVLALGVGFGQTVGVSDGFGILAMASIGPILSVLMAGVLVRWRLARLARHGRAEGTGSPLMAGSSASDLSIPDVADSAPSSASSGDVRTTPPAGASSPLSSPAPSSPVPSVPVPPPVSEV